MKNKKHIYRHGDVDIIEAEMPDGAVLKTRGQKLTIAYGEATGHHHTLYGTTPDAIIEYGYNEQRYLKIIEAVSLKHQEHNTLTILPGVYEISIEREYDYFENELTKVVD